MTIPPPAPPVLREEARRRALPQADWKTKGVGPLLGGSSEEASESRWWEGSRVGQEAEGKKTRPRDWGQALAA